MMLFGAADKQLSVNCWSVSQTKPRYTLDSLGNGLGNGVVKCLVITMLTGFRKAEAIPSICGVN